MRTRLPTLTVLLSLAFTPLSRSQSLTITTLAGSPAQGSADGTGAAARFANPWGVASDTAGNLYVADTHNHTIRQITAGGVVSTLAGLAGISGSADGTGSSARFYQPQGVAVDGAGNVYVADTGNYTIRKITPAGVVTTLAGSAGTSGSTDATGGSARFYEPEGIAVNSTGTVIYVADTWNHTIRQVTSAGVVTTLAGSAGNYGTNNGSGSSAQFNQPQGVAVDGAGNVYVGDTGNQTIRKVTPAGVVTTLAGSVGSYGSADGTGSGASFWAPQGVALDNAANLYVADSFNNTLRKVTPAGVVTTLAGTAGSFGNADGTGTAARFWQPQGVAVDGAGTVYAADSANSTIRQIVSGAVVTTLAGSASTGSADGAGSSARFYWPCGAAIDSGSTSYVADTGNGTIRTVTSAGVVTTLAGSAGSFGSTDATGSNARFYGPRAVAVDTSGNLYVADTANHTIRKITSSGVVSTLAGLAGNNGLADGTGSNARFNAPQGLAVNSSGTVYVADTWNHTIRKVTSAGVVTTLAGRPGYYGNIDGTSTGDGTNTARFYCPSGIAVDNSGNVFVADTRNHTIRKVTSAGVVSTLAGLAGSYGSADGNNSNARFYLPQSITVDTSGNLYVLDSGNQTVRKVALAGANWVVTAIAGQADVIGNADGTGSNVQFFYPGGLGMNSTGAFAVADWGNNTIRAGVSSLNASPTILVQPQNQTANLGQNATFSVTAAGSAPLTYQWLFYGTNLVGATASSYTCVNAQLANAGPYSVIVTNAYGMVTSSLATLTVILPPTITTQPQSQTVTQGLNAAFTVAASGTTPFSYQWQFNSAAISAATASGYTRTNAQPADAGSYSVFVSNSAGSVTSLPAILTVNPLPTPPAITAPPESQTVNQGATATFSVLASGTAPLSYQWRFNGASIGGATGTSYTRTSTQPADAGSYSVVVSNAFGTATSSDALLAVNMPPSITAQPQDQSVNQGASATFSVAANGTAPLSYQWRRNGVGVPGATAGIYTLSNVQPADAATYSVIVTNVAGSVTSSNATLAVNLPPAIGTQPQSQTVALGADVTFTVSATGTAPLSYQWLFNGAEILDATSASYTRANAQYADAGAYSVAVINVAGVTVSSNALLTVNAPPAITRAPESLAVLPGATASFSVQAAGSGTLSYQWQFNGTNLAGATGTSFTRTNVTAGDIGTYSAIVSNSFGFAASQGATLSPSTLAASINWSTVDGGGGSSAGGGWAFSGTYGQPDAGALSGGPWTFQGGFWNGGIGKPPPVASAAMFARTANSSLTIPISSLMTNAADPDGAPLSLVAVSATSTNGAAVTITGDSVLYSPANPDPNLADQFDYTVSDPFGGQATGPVLISVSGGSPPPPPTISGILSLSNGSAQLELSGSPNQWYYVQVATNVAPPVTWETMATNQADPTGFLQYIDSSATNFTTRYYRFAVP